MSELKPCPLEVLIDASMSVLHHDANEGDAVDRYERSTLREKFAAILHRAQPAPASPSEAEVEELAAFLSDMGADNRLYLAVARSILAAGWRKVRP